MTDNLRQAAKQALSIIDGMEQNYGNLWQVNASPEELDELCTSLREALAEPQDPVTYNGWVLREVLFHKGDPVGHREPPKAEQREPVGYWDGEFSKDGGATLYEVPQVSAFGRQYRNAPLYSAPQPAKQPLTDEQIKYATLEAANHLLDHIYEYGVSSEGVTPRIYKLARAIERAHGIAGETK